MLASSGAAASTFRASLRTWGKLGVARGWRPPNLAQYTTDAALREAAGRTNPFANAAGLGISAAGAYAGLGAGCN